MNNHPFEARNFARQIVGIRTLAFAAVMAVGCVSTAPAEGASDPSSAHAPTAPTASSAAVLDRGHAPIDDVSGTSSAPAAGHDHEHHAHSDHTTQAPGPAPHEHGGAAQPSSAEHQHTDKHEHGDKHAKMYTCPMHPEVRQGEPGRCSKCGMALELEESKE